MLEGSLLVIEGDRTTLLEQGEMYFFSPLEKVFHSSKKTFKATVKVLLISEGAEQDKVFYEEEGSSASAEG